LAGLLAALTGAVYWYEFYSKPVREKTKSNSNKILPIGDEMELDRLVIKNETKGIEVELQCRQNCKFNDPKADWTLNKPLSFDADDPNVGTFLAATFGADVIETLNFEGEEKPNLESFGLAENQKKNLAQLYVKGRSEPMEVATGDNTAIGGSVYAHTSDGRLLIVNHAVRVNLERDQTYWRNKKLFNFDGNKVIALKLVNKSGTIELKKIGDQWSFRDGKPAEYDTVSSFVTGFSYMQAINFVSDEKNKDFAKYGLSPTPSAKAVITLDDQKEVILDAYFPKSGDAKLKNKIFGAYPDKPFLFELDRAGGEKFGRERKFFRFRNLFAKGARQEFSRVEASFPNGNRYLFSRDGTDPSNWKIDSGVIPEFDTVRFSKSLDHVFKLRVLDFLGAEAPPKGSRQVSRWKILDPQGKTIAEFTLFEGPKDIQNHFVKVGAEWMKLELHDARDLPLEAKQWSKNTPATPTPAPLDPSQLKKGASNDEHHGHQH